MTRTLPPTSLPRQLQAPQRGAGLVWTLALLLAVTAAVSVSVSAAPKAKAKAKAKPAAKTTPEGDAATGAAAAPAPPAPASPVAPPTPASAIALIRDLAERFDRASAEGKALAAMHTSIAAALRQHMDYPEMARRAVGDEVWDKRSPADRAAMVDLLAKMVERSYVKRFKPGRKAVVTIAEQVKEGRDGKVQVRTQVQVDKTRADVAYSLHPVTGAWKIYDIVIDEASQLSSYRKSFRKILGNEGWDGLIARMRKSALD